MGVQRTSSTSTSNVPVNNVSKQESGTPGDDRRAVSFPLNAVIVLACVAAATIAVWYAGRQWFVQVPSLFIPIRNIAMVALLLVGGRAVMPRGDRRAEQILLIATLLFGLGLAMQFRLGHDAPRQLSGGEIDRIADSVRTARAGEPEDSVDAAITTQVRRRNGTLRREFELARLDVRLARSLEEAYGPSDTTTPFLQGRVTAPADPLLFRLLPIVALIGGVILFARTRVPTALTSRWRIIGLYGSLLLCGITFLYLGAVGGIRGSSISPQELLKLTVPIAWAGLLLHYRHAFLGASLAKMTDTPVVLWLYVLALLALPLLVFVAVRDFGQFLAIGVAQIVLLAWYSRNPLYILLFAAGLTIASIILLGESITFASPIVLVAAVIGVTVLALAARERFATKGTLWPTASIVLGGFGLLAWLSAQLPFVRDVLSTPRSRFLLWADLYGRHGDPMWWDNSRQVIEALYAFDAGGFLGSGFGGGTPFLIPKAGSDFIFAAFVEETGLVGGILLILLIIGLVILGLRIAADRGAGSFLGLLAAGYALMLGAQSFVHIAGTMNIMPMTGITLPLVSSGMSSLIVSWMIVGALIGLAFNTDAPAGAVAPGDFKIKRPAKPNPGSD